MATVQQHASKRPWHRFTIAEFFIFVLGVGAGLAHARIERVSWPEPLFTTFAVWLVVGMIQAAWREIREARAAGIHATEPSSYVLAIAKPAFVILLIVLAALLELDKHEHWMRSEALDIPASIGASGAISFLFYLAVICSYSSTLRRAPAPSRRRMQRSIVSAATWGLAGIWLMMVLWSTCLIAALVHAAVHGIRLGQPYRRTGVEIYPFEYPEPLTQQLMGGAILAALLMVGAGAMIFVLSNAWNRRPRMRAWLIVCWFMPVVATGGLLAWCYCFAFPKWSPFLAPLLFAEPFAIGLAVLLLIVSSAAFAARSVAELHPGSQPTATFKGPLFHQRLAVAILFLIAVAWSMINYAREFGWFPDVNDLRSAWAWVRSVVEVHLLEPELLVKVAAFLCVIGWLWRKWRLKEDASERVTLRPARFFVFWGIWFVTGLVAVPSFAWLGFTLAFW